MDRPTTRLSGWGGNLRADCVLREPELPREVAAAVDRAGTIPRGLGRSYGDAALNAGGQVLGLRHVDRYLTFDAEAGVLSCEAGVSLEQIIRDFAPRGWFPMITPGTKFVTVGGCIANDVHGKAHHAQGCFSVCVDDMTVLLASGVIVRAARDENADLFWATFGGMGLLGIVLTARIRLRKIETTFFRQKAVAVNDLEAMLAALEDNDRAFSYSVATLDVMATGARLGRVIRRGGHVPRDVPHDRSVARRQVQVRSALRIHLRPRPARGPRARGGGARRVTQHPASPPLRLIEQLVTYRLQTGHAVSSPKEGPECYPGSAGRSRDVSHVIYLINNARVGAESGPSATTTTTARPSRPRR